MTNKEKGILRSVCILSINKEMALKYMYSYFINASKNTFNKYWKFYGCKGLQK